MRNRPFQLKINDIQSRITRDYTPGGIKLAVPFELGVKYFTYANSFYNITEKNNNFSMRRWRYATTRIGEYFPEKLDDDMLEYKSNITISPGNYELEEIIENLNSHEKLKNSRTKISIDPNKLKVRLISEWDVDFTRPNTIARVLGFENKVLRAYTEHVSDFIPQLFEVNEINIHVHHVNSNIEDENTHSDIIYSCPLDHSKIGTNTVKEPSTVLYSPLTTDELMCLGVYFTDQNGKPIIFQEHYTVLLSFRPIL